jgi:hypothetical protein
MKNKHHNVYLQSAWKKYGEDNFEFEILEEYDISNCIKGKFNIVDGKIFKLKRR